jgi:hypothetical protein
MGKVASSDPLADHAAPPPPEESPKRATIRSEIDAALERVFALDARSLGLGRILLGVLVLVCTEPGVAPSTFAVSHSIGTMQTDAMERVRDVDGWYTDHRFTPTSTQAKDPCTCASPAAKGDIAAASTLERFFWRSSTSRTDGR